MASKPTVIRTQMGTLTVGAIASDLGLDWRAVRGIGLVARTVGLVGDVFEEIRQPTGDAVWDPDLRARRVQRFGPRLKQAGPRLWYEGGA